MEDTSNSAMIALLPMTSEWCRIDLPHLTLVYAGLVPDLQPTVFNELSKDGSMLAMLSKPITLKVMRMEVFGDVDKVDALKLQPSQELWAMRRAVEKWNASDFPFNPHVTIGPVEIEKTIDIPRYLVFNRIHVAWGKDCLTFSLNNGAGSGY